MSLNFNKTNYVLAVVNDPDTGSQIANVTLATPWGVTPTTTPPVRSGVTGAALVLDPATKLLQAVNTAFGGSATATVANDDYSLLLSTSQPATPPAPLPLPPIKIFAKNGPIPQTVASLASRVEQTINASLAVNWPGAAVRCAAVDGGGGNQAIRVVGFLPGHDDAELSFGAPAGPLKDASGPLGLAALTNVNVAHYTLGTGNNFGSQTASTAGTDGTGLPGTTQLVGDEISFTGIYALRKVDLFNLLCIPDATRARQATRTRSTRRSIPNAIYRPPRSAYAANRRAMLLVDPPPGVRDVALGGGLEDHRAYRPPGERRGVLPPPAPARPGEQLPAPHLRALRRGRRAVRPHRQHARRLEGAGRHRGDADRRAGSWSTS